MKKAAKKKPVVQQPLDQERISKILGSTFVTMDRPVRFWPSGADEAKAAIERAIQMEERR